MSSKSKITFKIYTWLWNTSCKSLATFDILNHKNNIKFQNYLKHINILKFNGRNFLTDQEVTFRKKVVLKQKKIAVCDHAME